MIGKLVRVFRVVESGVGGAGEHVQPPPGDIQQQVGKGRGIEFRAGVLGLVDVPVAAEPFEHAPDWGDIPCVVTTVQNPRLPGLTLIGAEVYTNSRLTILKPLCPSPWSGHRRARQSRRPAA